MESAHPRVDIITVCYNGRPRLDDFFASIGALAYPKDRLRLFFVDNASQDDSVAVARSCDPGFVVEVIVNEQNLGFAAANNLALARCDAPFVALLNNDTKVEPDWLSRLTAKISSDPGIAVAGSRQVPQESSRKIDPVTQETSWCGGGHCLIRTEALGRAGYLDERFFMYGEDIDLCWRMWLAGYSCVYVPDAVCRHHYDGAVPFLARRMYYHVRNSILLRYAYGEHGEVKQEIARWVREGFAKGLRHLRFRESCAIFAGVLGHYCHTGYFLKKGAELKKNARFEKIRMTWITL